MARLERRAFYFYSQRASRFVTRGDMALHSIKISRLERHLVLLSLYTAVLAASFWLAYQIRFEFAVPEIYERHYVRVWPFVIVAKLLCLLACGQFAALLTYFSIPDLRRVALATVVPFALLMASWQFGVAPIHAVDTPPSVPRGVLVIDTMLSFAGLVMVRLMFRLVRERRFQSNTADAVAGDARRVAIMGAGEVGASLARELMAKPRLGMRPVVFFDDDASKIGGKVHGIPVAGALTDAASLDGWNIDEVVIAMPSAPARRIQSLVQLLQRLGLPHKTVPSLEQLAAGRVKVTELRPVAIEDLLGRQRVELQTGEIAALLRGQRVLVTGAGGSIGSELCRQILAHQPAQLTLVERSEIQMFAIQQELLSASASTVLHAAVADITDLPRMRDLLCEQRPQVIFHAAAHKHVPLMETQPAEALRNNTFGTMRLADLAREHGVECFVFISTDKAINPTSVMGASKRLAELYLQSLNAAHAGPTRFMAVRFGNVLGSSGSVVPVFARQIAAGGPVTVTHPDMQRYFMLTCEAVGLVLQSATMGRRGEVFVLDMGAPMKIAELARQMIELSGLRPETDIPIIYTGLRPGEKMFEELRLDGEEFVATAHPKVLCFTAAPAGLPELRARLEEMERRAAGGSATEIKSAIRQLVPEYTPAASAEN